MKKDEQKMEEKKIAMIPWYVLQGGPGSLTILIKNTTAASCPILQSGT